jgi:DNA-directed RNA polymerase alpha subunit
MINLATRIDEVEFGNATSRLRNILYKNKIYTVGGLMRLSADDILKLPCFGRGRLVSVKQTLESMGFHLAAAGKMRNQTSRMRNVSAK